jgi:CHAT domain-containing protein/tetratricopeptide (TPR) repeat protein
MSKRTVAIALMLAAAAVLTRVRAQEPTKKPADEPVLKVAGELTRDDPVDPVLKKGFHRVYPVKLAADAYYQIDLVSKDFDAYLRLEDAEGRRLAEDDDSGGDLNARLLYKPDKTDSFRIIVTTYDAAKTGKFLLTVTKSDRAAAEQQQLLSQANALIVQMNQLYQKGRLPEATERLRKALELYRQAFSKDKYPQGHPTLADSLQGLGMLLYAQREYAKAEPFWREALEMRQTLYPKAKYSQGHPNLAISLNNLGVLLQASGEYGEAEPLLRQALEMTQTLYPKDKYPQGHPQLATSLNYLGNLLQTRGEYGKAEPYYRQALEMNQTLYPKDKYPHGHPDLTASVTNLGVLFHLQAEYGKAEPYYRQALEMNQTLYPKDKYPHGHPDLAGSLNNLGAWLTFQGEYGKAEPFLRQALEMAQRLYPKHQYPQGHANLAASLYSLGDLLMDKGDYGAAEPFYRQALEIRQRLYPKERYPKGHSDLAKSLTNLGVLFRTWGKDGKAEVFFRQALAMTQTLYPKDQYPQGHPDLAVSLNNLGFLLRCQGEYGNAEPFCRRALAMHTQLAIRLARVAPEPVALNALSTFPLSRDGLVSVTRHLPDSDIRTYDLVWHSRAALTRVYQRRHLALIAAATDDSIRKAWDELQALRRQRELLIMAPAPKNPSLREVKLRELNNQIDKAELELLPQLPDLKHYEDLAKLGPDALRKLLPANAVVIDFLRYVHFEQDPGNPGIKGEQRTVRYLAFVVSRHQVQRVELGMAAEIEPAVRDWRATITARLPARNDTARNEHEAKLVQQAAAMRQLVWEPIEKRLPVGAATVYMAPDGAMTQLPWAGLPGKGKDRVLLDDYALAVLPHGPFLLEQLTPGPPRSVRRPPAAEGLLLVGGIRYDEQPAPRGVTSRGAEGVVEQKIVWNYLKGADEERELLAQVLEKSGPKVTASLGGTEAATGRLRQELEHCRYAHVSTHGFFADGKFRSLLQLDPKLLERRESREGLIGNRSGEGARSPLVLSGLVCSGANLPATPERGILSGDAIAGLLLDDLRMAVLSACDTAIGEVAGGEGVFGLQRAFHIAGCKNVVASLWKVDDAATAALMVRFYGHLFAEDAAKRLPPIEALRRAQLELYRHPELIPAWAKGEQRAPGPPRPATTPPPPETPRELVTSDGRAPIRLWAAFTLSGAGR